MWFVGLLVVEVRRDQSMMVQTSNQTTDHLFSFLLFSAPTELCIDSIVEGGNRAEVGEVNDAIWWW